MKLIEINYIVNNNSDIDHVYKLIYNYYNKRFNNLSLSHFSRIDDDFVQICNITLYDSLLKYDKGKGIKFTTYFESNLKKCKFDFFNSKGELTLDRKKRFNKLSNQDELSSREFEDILLMEKIYNTQTFSELSHQDEEGNEIPFEPYALDDTAEINLMLYDLENILSDIEFLILKLTYKRYKQYEIAKMLGITQQAVSKYFVRIEKKVREYIYDN